MAARAAATSSEEHVKQLETQVVLLEKQAKKAKMLASQLRQQQAERARQVEHEKQLELQKLDHDEIGGAGTDGEREVPPGKRSKS